MLMSSCAQRPESYPPPPQRRDFTGPDPKPLSNFVSMSQTWADRYIVRDVVTGPPPGPSRWTFVRPELKFVLTDTKNQKLMVNFNVADATFKTTGPLTVTFFVNGQELGQQACGEAGTYHFEAPVPDGWLKAGEPTLVAAQADKLWTSPTDGARLGFLLTDIGFLPQ